MVTGLKIAVCQMLVREDPAENLAHAAELVRHAAEQQAEVVVLPEMFTIPYSLYAMKAHAFSLPGTVVPELAAWARENRVLLVAGSLPEQDESGRYYNTNLVFSPEGEQLSRYRKTHLFDIDLAGRVSFQESAVLSAGNTLSVIHYGDWTLSVLICYDARFPELFRLAVDKGAQLICIPASFAKVTGEMHWELTMRCRAVDHQVFVAAASTARNPENDFQPWGHSLIADPWGKVLAQAETEETILYAELDPQVLIQARQELPLLKHRRSALYELLPHLEIIEASCSRSMQ